MDRILSPRYSRRGFLRVGAAAAGGGAIAGIGLASSQAAAPGKVAKESVNYQQTPKGQARCATCTFFQSPSSCTYVSGPINPSGWCTLYRAKGESK